MSRAEIWRFRRYQGTPKPDRGHTAMLLGRPRTSVVLGILKAPTVWPVQRRRPARPTMLARRGIAVWDRVTVWCRAELLPRRDGCENAKP